MKKDYIYSLSRELGAPADVALVLAKHTDNSPASLSELREQLIPPYERVCFGFECAPSTCCNHAVGFEYY
jgi:hypothetical protein